MAKTTQIQLRVTDEQKTALKKAADDSGVSMTVYILQAALDRANGKEKKGRRVPYARIGREEIAVKDLLAVPIVMRTEEEK